MYTLGIDIGSTTSKCAVLRDGGERLAASLALGGIGTKGPASALDTVLKDAGLALEDMAAIAATGYGRAHTPPSPRSARWWTSAARTPRSSPWTARAGCRTS